MKRRNELPKAALEFFRRQGSIGGLKRASNLSPEERSEQARLAVQVRWAKQAEKDASKKGKK
jgi:hypothetical protein